VLHRSSMTEDKTPLVFLICIIRSDLTLLVFLFHHFGLSNMQLQLCQTVNPPVTNNILTLTCDISELINLHDEGFNGFDPSMRPKHMVLVQAN